MLLLAVTSGPVVAGSESLKDWTEGDKVEKKVYFGITSANVKQLQSQGKLPKRVGLVSFYILDSGTTDFNAMAYTYGGTYQASFGMNAKGANTFASELAKLGVPALKEQFAAHGMELVTPIEFLDTDERKRAYVDFVLPRSGLAKATLAIVDWVDKNPHAEGAADGYESILTSLWSDAKSLNALEELRAALGLDALAVLANATSSNPGSVILSSITLELYGPNPLPRPENKLAATGYTNGINYVKGIFGKGFKGVELVLWKKGEIKETRYEGYDAVVGSLARTTLEEFKKISGQK
jgi:hypothetical protein